MVPSKLSRKIPPHLLDASQGGQHPLVAFLRRRHLLDTFLIGWVIVALHAVHAIADFLNKVLQRLQIIGIFDGVFIVLCTKTVEGGEVNQWR